MPLGVMRKHIKYYLTLMCLHYIHIKSVPFIIEVMVLQLKQYK